MTPQDYKELWSSQGNELLSPINSTKLLNWRLQPNTIEYLKIGLPLNTAPFLSFNRDSETEYNRIGTLSDIYDIDSSFDKYIVIGSDGSGNPITINREKNDVIEWLDHEDYFSSSYFNTSIKSLLTFLLIYRDFIEITQAMNGEYAYIDANFTDEDFNAMKQKMLMVDSIAVYQPGFWKEELALLLANREYYRKQN